MVTINLHCFTRFPIQFPRAENGMNEQNFNLNGN